MLGVQSPSPLTGSPIKAGALCGLAPAILIAPERFQTYKSGKLVLNGSIFRFRGGFFTSLRIITEKMEIANGVVMGVVEAVVG